MVERCVIDHRDWTRAPGARVVTSSGEVANMPANQVLDPQVARRWRTLSKTGSVTIDFGQARDIDVLAAVQPWDSEDEFRSYAMIGASDQVTHKLSLLSDTGDEVLNQTVASGVAQGYGLHAYFLSSTLSARYWTFEFDAASVPQSFTDWGKLWASPLIRTSVNPDWGYSDDWQDDSEIDEAPRSGVEYVDETTRRRVVSFGFSGLNEAEGRDTIKELTRKVGKRGQVFFARDPDGAYVGTEAIIGRFRQSVPLSHPVPRRYSAPIVIRQSL